MNLSHSLNKQIDNVHQSGAHVTFTKKELEELPTSKIKMHPYIMNLSVIIFILTNFTIINFMQILFLVIICISFKLVQHHVKPISYILPKINPKKDNSSSIFIGNIISNYPKKKYYLSVDDLKKHMFVCGLTGMGKSNFIKNFIKIIHSSFKNIPFLLFEFKGEYNELAQYNKEIEILKPGLNLTINIFDPEGCDFHVYSENLLNLLISCQIITFYEDYSAQMEKLLSELLFKVISDVNRRNWEGFDYYTHVIIEKYKNDIPNVIQSVMGINNRLRRLKSGSLKTIFENKPKKTFQSIINSKIIIDLSNIIHLGGTKNDAVFFSNILFNKIWQMNLDRGKTDTIQHFTIVEDAQFFLSQKMTNNLSQTNYLEDVALLLRGTGECLITVSTRPTISEDVMANAGIIVAFQQFYDQSLMGRLLALNVDKLNYITQLKVGECLVKTNSISTPFIIKVPIFSHKNQYNKFTNFMFNITYIIRDSFRKSKNFIISCDLHTLFQYISQKIKKSCLFCLNLIPKFKIKKGGLQPMKNNSIDSILDNEEVLKKDFRNIPTSLWVKHLRNAENLYLIEQYKFAYIECDNLFMNVYSILRKKMQTKMDFENDTTIDGTITKLFSPDFQDLLKSFEEVHNVNIDNINELLVERYLALLKRMFLIMKVKNKTYHDFSNEDHKNYLKKTSNNNEYKLIRKKLDESNPTDREIIDEDKSSIPFNLWNELRNAIINYEKS